VLFETLAEEGVPGGMLVIALLGAIIVATVRCAWRAGPGARAPLAAAAAACAAGIVSLATDWSWQVAVVPVSMLALGGLSLGQDPVPARTRAPWSPVAIAARLGIIAAAFAALASIAIPLATTSKIRQSQAAFRRGAISQAFGDARSATSLEPYAATPWLQQALVLESTGHLAAAERAVRRAARNEPSNWRVPLVLARIQAERGEISSSLKSARRALALNPSIRVYLR
jgi:tetratricopeptide (TPR) repeat protein